MGPQGLGLRDGRIFQKEVFLPLVWTPSSPGNTICKCHKILPTFFARYLHCIIGLHSPADLFGKLGFYPLPHCTLYKHRNFYGFFPEFFFFRSLLATISEEKDKNSAFLTPFSPISFMILLSQLSNPSIAVTSTSLGHLFPWCKALSDLPDPNTHTHTHAHAYTRYTSLPFKLLAHFSSSLHCQLTKRMILTQCLTYFFTFSTCQDDFCPHHSHETISPKVITHLLVA